MSVNQSNLTNAHYGYDFVVATTQESINATMKEYLYNTIFPVVKMYWNQDNDGNPVPVSYDDLMKQTNGTDPLTVASWNTGDPMSQDIQNINNSDFYFAFEASIGIPPNVPPLNIPDIITLQPASQSVIFSLLCAQFTIITCNFGRHGLTSFFSTSQPADTPWMFTSTVPLKNITNNTGLPQNVQQQLNNFGPDAFSVQQLIFDLDNAALESTPTIGGITPGTPTYTLLSQVFLGAYFTAMKTTSQPILGYAVVKNTPPPDQSSLVLTDMNMGVSQYIDPNTKTGDNNDLNTLNYLCATNGDTLPPPTPFDWNWVEQSEEANIHGAIAINRDTFRNYFQNQLTGYIMQNCFAASVKVDLVKDIPQYTWNLTPGQSPTITPSQTGAGVLTYEYSSSAFDQAGLDGDMGRMRLTSTYTASVTFTGNTIVIVQTLLVAIYIRRLANSLSWNPINKTITDTYTLAVTEQGNLTARLDSTTQDNADKTPSENWFIELFTKLNDLANDVAKWMNNFSPTALSDMPVSVAQQFVFPGGKTFTFEDVSFSAYQDLVAHISYVQTA